MKSLFMDQAGKTNIDENLKYVCPPHYIPHKLPDGEPITDEKCHIHTEKNRLLRRWRRTHHNSFCIIFCPHYERMIKETKQYDDKL